MEQQNLSVNEWHKIQAKENLVVCYSIKDFFEDLTNHLLMQFDQDCITIK